jgi:hypothetical protein
MFERYEIDRDVGDFLIRAFSSNSGMVVARIRYSDLEYIQADKLIKILDEQRFIENNMDVFLKILWKRYQNGKTEDRYRLGTKYKYADLDLDEDLLPNANEFSE